MPRILTYNVHRFVGTDRKVSAARTAEVIAACGADVVLLQEARVGSYRKTGFDLEAIARHLGMELHFEPTIRLFGEQFGLAVLTALPTRRIKAGALPTLPNRGSLEARKALWVGIEVGGCELQIVNHHLSLLSRRERLLQVDTLLGAEWLGGRPCVNPVVVVGDLNTGAGSKAYWPPRRGASRRAARGDAAASPADLPCPPADAPDRPHFRERLDRRVARGGAPHPARPRCVRSPAADRRPRLPGEAAIRVIPAAERAAA